MLVHVFIRKADHSAMQWISESTPVIFLNNCLRQSFLNPINRVNTFVHVYRINNPEERFPCTKTVYALINQGVLSVRNIDLPMKIRLRKASVQNQEGKTLSISAGALKRETNLFYYVKN